MGERGRDAKDTKYDNIEQAKTTFIEDFEAVCMLGGSEPKRYYSL